MKIKFKIELLSNWHIGSGLDAGAEADALVLKDENNLPYIPGKTIKGLLKDSLQEIVDVGQVSQSLVNELFGYEVIDSTGKVQKTLSGKSFFMNAELTQVEKDEIKSHDLSEHLYKNIASTAINKEGVAKKNSLRTLEVCLPVTLYGEIEINDWKEEYKDTFEMAFKWTRALGVNRNRGLGRCRFELIENN